LSPLLFVLAAELLQVLINRAAAINLLKAPIPQQTNDFPIVQYADDTLLIMQADACQLFFLKSLLNSFAESMGLKVNYRKSSMLPINVPQKECNVWQVLLDVPLAHYPSPTGVANGNNQTTHGGPNTDDG
jgi:hypothetical protein